jgi:beta-glucosidase
MFTGLITHLLTMDSIYKNPSRSPEERTEDLLSLMTLREKLGQMMQLAAHFDFEKHLAFEPGSMLHIMNEQANVAMDFFEQTRLQIPLLIGEDCIHGHSFFKGATIFPTQLSIASSWNTELMQEVAAVTAKEVATSGVHWTFSPVLCLSRDLRWGRTGETFGEDPGLIGRFGEAFIRGYQGEGLHDPQGILATAKHYVGYSETQGGRDASEADISVRKLRSYFMPPFERASVAGCMSYMTGYQSIEGVPSTANRWLLNDVLKDEWGFEGIVVTDWNNVGTLVTSQKICADYAEAATVAIRSGNDLIMQTPEFMQGAIDAIDRRMLQESEVDAVVRRILLLKFRMGLFENPRRPNYDAQRSVIHCAEHKAVNLQAARESMVLLQNPGKLLPLQRQSVRKISVLGPQADSPSALLGDWSLGAVQYPPEAGMHPAELSTTLLQGIQALAGDGVEVSYLKGAKILEDDRSEIEAAVALAAASDAVVIALGDTYELLGEYQSTATLELQGSQLALLEALVEAGKPVVVVMIASKPLVLPAKLLERAAILNCFNPGMEGGRAVAEVLFGDFNPLGKLTISIPYHVGQQPVFYSQVSGQHGDRYADMTQDPHFAFGQGLSYTSFAYRDLKVLDTEVPLDGALRFSIQLTNTGDCSGTEITQLYVSDLVTSATWVKKRLQAYQRTTLASGASKILEFTVPVRELWLVDAQANYVVEPGAFEVQIGASSRDADLLKAEFKVVGDQPLRLSRLF